MRGDLPLVLEECTTGSLYTLDPDAETQTFYLLPDAPPGAEPAYFEGQLEDVGAGGAAAGAADAECVAIYDEATGQWTLELLAYKLPTRLKRGEPPGAGLLARDGAEPAAEAATAATAQAGPHVQALPSAAFDGALDDALFGDDDGSGGDGGNRASGGRADAAHAPAPPQQQQQQPPRVRRGVVIEDDGGGGGGEPHECSDDDSDGIGLEAF